MNIIVLSESYSWISEEIPQRIMNVIMLSELYSWISEGIPQRFMNIIIQFSSVQFYSVQFSLILFDQCQLVPGARAKTRTSLARYRHVSINRPLSRPRKIPPSCDQIKLNWTELNWIELNWTIPNKILHIIVQHENDGSRREPLVGGADRGGNIEIGEGIRGGI